MDPAWPVIGASMPIETPFLHETADVAATVAGRAMAAATIASAATDAAVAISPIILNIPFPPLGLPKIRRCAAKAVCRSDESGG
jgi:hypothetical protein